MNINSRDSFIWVRGAFHLGNWQPYKYKSYTHLEPTVILSGSNSHARVLHDQKIRIAMPVPLRVLLLVHGLSSLLVLCKVGLLVGDLLPERGELLGLLLLDIKALLSSLLLVERVAGRSTA